MLVPTVPNGGPLVVLFVLATLGGAPHVQLWPIWPLEGSALPGPDNEIGARMSHTPPISNDWHVKIQILAITNSIELLAQGFRSKIFDGIPLYLARVIVAQ